jgi:hypothetical protein
MLNPMCNGEYGSDYIELRSSVLYCCYNDLFNACSNIFLLFSSLLSIYTELSHSTSLMIPGESQLSYDVEMGMYYGASLRNYGTKSWSEGSVKLN